MRKTKAASAKTSIASKHWRLLGGVAAGVVTWLIVRHLGVPKSSQVLIGWDVGAGIYLVLVWRLLLTASEAEVRARAAQEDEGPSVMLAIVLTAIVASLAAVVAAMINARGSAYGVRMLTAACAGATLLISWVVLQSVFVLHYAHRHFGDGPGKGGFGFPGEPASTYRDFVYLAFSVGATFQVSDNSVRTSRLRNLVTTHAVTAYFYNTAILALGINIIAGIVGQ